MAHSGAAELPLHDPGATAGASERATSSRGGAAVNMGGLSRDAHQQEGQNATCVSPASTCDVLRGETECSYPSLGITSQQEQKPKEQGPCDETTVGNRQQHESFDKQSSSSPQQQSDTEEGIDCPLESNAPLQHESAETESSSGERSRQKWSDEQQGSTEEGLENSVASQTHQGKNTGKIKDSCAVFNLPPRDDGVGAGNDIVEPGSRQPDDDVDATSGLRECGMQRGDESDDVGWEILAADPRMHRQDSFVGPSIQQQNNSAESMASPGESRTRQQDDIAVATTAWVESSGHGSVNPEIVNSVVEASNVQPHVHGDAMKEFVESSTQAATRILKSNTQERNNSTESEESPVQSATKQQNIRAEAADVGAECPTQHQMSMSEAFVQPPAKQDEEDADSAHPEPSSHPTDRSPEAVSRSGSPSRQEDDNANRESCPVDPDSQHLGHTAEEGRCESQPDHKPKHVGDCATYEERSWIESIDLEAILKESVSKQQERPCEDRGGDGTTKKGEETNHGMEDTSGASPGEYDMESSDEECDASVVAKTHQKKKVDVNRVLELLDAASTALANVKGRNVVILAGKTGTGKTTLIHAVAGRRLRQVRCESIPDSGCGTVLDVYEAETPIDGFAIGHKQASQTKHINYFLREGDEHAVIYLDSSGYEDTAGIEADIATSISFKQVADLCHTMRFAVLINCHSLLDSRGGGIRGVVKLVASFVDDFKANQCAFTFLFTHVEALFGAAELSLDGTRDKLWHLIEETRKGTEEPGDKYMLKWMAHCLKKRLPFADIFHPEKSDVPKLIQDLEMFTPHPDGTRVAIGMKSGEVPKDIVRCGLTPAMKSTMVLELGHLLDDLKMALHEENLEKVLDLSKTFDDVVQHLQFAFVHDIGNQAAYAIGRYIKTTANKAYEVVQLGTVGLGEFGVSAAKTALIHIAILNRLVSATKNVGKEVLMEVHRGIGILLRQLYEAAEAERPRLADARCMLSKLQAWGEAHEAFKIPVGQAVAALEQSIQGAIDWSYNAQLIVDEPAASVCALVRLELCRQRIADFQLLGVLEPKLEDACKVAWDHEEQVTQETTEHGKHVLNSGLVEQFPLYKRSVLMLEAKYAALHEAAFLPSLEAKVDAAWRVLLAEAEKEVATRANAVRQSLHANSFGQLEGQMLSLIKMFEAQTERQQVRAEMVTTINSVHREVEEALRKQVTMVQAFSDQMAETGLGSTEKHMEPLSVLVACSWYDNRLPPERRFVRGSLTELQKKYNDYLQMQNRSAIESLEDFMRDPRGEKDKLEILRKSLPEVRSFTAFDSIYPSLADAWRQLIKRAKVVMQEWSADHTPLLSQFPECLTELEGLPADKLNQMLTVMHGLKTIVTPFFSEPVELLHLEAVLRQGLHECCSRIEALQGEPAQYETKLAVFRALTSWQEFDEIKVSLPSLVSFRETVCNHIVTCARDLRVAIAESANWEQAAVGLEAFTEASTLDEFTGTLASNEIDNLDQMLTMKRANVDKTFQRKLADNDFSNLGDLLKPLAESSDPDRRARHGEMLKAAASKVESQISNAGRIIASGESFAKALAILEQADGELGQPLKEHHSIDLADAVQKFRKRAGEHFQYLLNNIESALKFSDFQEGEKMRKVVVEYQDAMKHVLHAELQERAEKDIQAMQDLFGTISAKLIALVDNARRPSQERVDTSECHIALANMKSADPELMELVSFYQSSVVELANRLNAMHHELQKSTAEKQTFSVALEVYTYLRKEWENGLHDHLPPLEFDIGKELDVCQSKEQEAVRAYQAYLCTPDDIDKNWFPVLEDLRGGWSWWCKQQYDHHRHALLRGVRDRTQVATKQLALRNYESAGSYAAALKHIHQKLRSHLAPDVCRGISSFQEQAQSNFTEIATDLLGAITRDDISEFELLFTRFYKYMLHFSDSHPEFKDQSIDIHKSIYSNLKTKIARYEEQLTALDFGTAVSSVKTLQRAACVFSGIFALYSEDIHGSTIGDAGLQQLRNLCKLQFGGEKIAEVGRHLAFMNVPITATDYEIELAYQRKVREYDVRVSKRRDSPKFHKAMHTTQQRVQYACESLKQERNREEYQAGISDLFTASIKSLGTSLRSSVQHCVEAQNYHQLKAVFVATKDLVLLKEIVPSLDTDAICKDVHDRIQTQVHKIQADVWCHWDRRELCGVHTALTELSRIEEHFGMYPSICDSSTNADVRRGVESEIETIANRAKSYLRGNLTEAEAHMREFASQLIAIGRILDDLPRFKEIAATKINNLLETCQDLHWGYTYLFRLGTVLSQGKVGRLDSDGKVHPEDERIGKVIVSEFRQFGDVLTMMWNDETDATQKDVHSTIQGVESAKVSPDGRKSILDVDKNALLEGYERYKEAYDTHFHSWRAGDLQLDDLVKLVVDAAGHLQPCSVTVWKKNVKDAIPVLLAGILAYFTIAKSGESYTRLLHAGSAEEEVSVADPDSPDVGTSATATRMVKMDSVLLKPHNIQIITLLRMLGFDTEQETLDNHLMHVRTGEGKSMILGACSVLLALLGFKVRCVCYSADLSRRDHKLFSDPFTAFGVADRIVYSRITTYSEDATESKGDVRALTLDLLRSRPEGGPTSDLTGVSPREPSAIGEEGCKEETPSGGEILLVDEVDVFFGKDFYGQTHNQVASLDEPEVSAVLRLVWNSKDKASTPKQLFNMVKASAQYNKLLKKFARWPFLTEHEVSLMCSEVREFDNPAPHYDRARNRLGYKVMDSIDFDVVYGYRTAFAYLNEADKRTLRDEDDALREALKMRVPCGQFSYANIRPTCILGVSGTVGAMGEYEWKVMNRYNVQVYSRLPSVYGSSNFEFLEHESAVKIVPSEEHFQSITDAVKSKVDIGRAVIVFFKDYALLDKYEASSNFRTIAHRNLLKESQSAGEKEYAIKKAATAGQATFTTAIFGRGTDFVCSDRRLLDAGGVHVLQTFLSLDESEEVQIKGRTARQGKKGTYAMLLSANDVREQLGLSGTDTRGKTPTQLYDLLAEKRKACQRQACELTEKNLDQANERDNLSHAYFDKLLAKDISAASALFEHLYTQLQRKPRLKPCRMMCLSDATGSMTGIWGSTRDHIGEMLRRVAEIGGDNLELMWVAYRDYSDLSLLLQKSAWTHDAESLKGFVDTIVCTGGGDHEEAVEHAMAEVRVEAELQEVTRVILIADAPPHFEKKGQKLTGHDHVLKTDYMTEAQELAKLGIPVYTFYLNSTPRLVSSFRQIAETTGGAAAFLDKRDKLIDGVCLAALDDIGGGDLVAEYKERYGTT